MPDKSVDLVLTDPPYGIDYQSARRIDTERFSKIDGDQEINHHFIEEAYRLLKEDCGMYIFTRWDVYPKWADKIQSAGFKIKNVIIWDRVIHGLGDLSGSYAPQHDFIIYAIKGKPILKNGRPKDIIRVKRPDVDKMIHPTEKPIKLIRELIVNSTNKGDVVLDCFLGSGTTAIACKQLNRRWVGFEISPEYCKIIEKRLSQKVMTEFFDTQAHSTNVCYYVQ
ncbi:MAG: DNA-methyltransferase [Bacillota bacterium]